jgi:hypothetical protein
VDHDTRLAELSKIVWRWRSGQLSRRTALRLLANLGISLCGGLVTISAARGMNHQPGHIDEQGGDPDAGGAEAQPGSSAATELDTSYDPDLNPDLMNPERGMYFEEYPGDTTDSRRQTHTIVPRWLNLTDWCNKDLTWDPDNPDRTSQVLTDYAVWLEEARTKTRELGFPMKVLFRPRYDQVVEVAEGVRCNVPSNCTFVGGGSEKVFHADSLERQKNHIDAVATMLADYADVIAFIHAGYLGNWGEWNTASSSDQCPSYSQANAPLLYCCTDRNAIIDHMLSAYAAAGITQDVELRTPVFAKEVVERYTKDGKPPPNIGLHNDCFMSSKDNDVVPVDGSDSGTYSDFFGCCPPPCDCCCPPEAPCDSPPPCDCPQTCCRSSNCRSLENFESEVKARAWAAEWTAGSSFGGETCPAGGTERWRHCRNMIGANSEPALLHMTYLNGHYAEGAVDAWELGDADGDTCYADIRRDLGYRFVVNSVEYTRTVAGGQKFFVRVEVENTGWGRLDKPRVAKLVLRNGTNPPLEYPFSGGSVSDWAPGPPRTISVSDSAPPGTYQVRLWIPDPDAEDQDATVRTNYAVKLATLRANDMGQLVNVFDPDTGENDLGVEITVQPIDRDPPVISGVSSQVWVDPVTGLSAYISWQTDEPADTQVEYGSTPGLGTTTTRDPDLRYSHTVWLTLLDPRNPYYLFEVKSRDAEGNLATASGLFSPPP